MRKTCPNFDTEDGLDTVLEVPIPEEVFMATSTNPRSNIHMSCCSMMSWVRSHVENHWYQPSDHFDRADNLQFMLGVIGAPLLPMPIQTRQSSFVGRNIKDDPIEVSMAKYIVQQYIAAVGGEKALDSVGSMYAMGKTHMMFGESNGTGSNKKLAKRGGEMGGFVLWQKKPDLWCLELVVSGSKLSAGSDGKVVWRQTPGQESHASRGPPRPLRRILQGLDPRSTANLFSNAICDGEKAANGEDCFVLRVDTELSSLRARSTKSMDVIRHTVLGYFSQRTGLLIQLEDSHLIKTEGAHGECVYWETTTETSIEEYRPVDAISISHKGWTSVSLVRFSDTIDSKTSTRIEEAWSVEEVDFNLKGLSMECFLPPRELNEEQEHSNAVVNTAKLQAGIARLASSKVAALNVEDSDSSEEGDVIC